MRGRIVAQFVLAVLVAGCGGATLQEYTSPDGRYQVVFPGKPQVTEETPATPAGPMPTRTVALKDGARIERVVVTIDFPGRFNNRAAMEKKLDSVCEAWLSENESVLTSKSPTQVNGHPARELNFETVQGGPSGKRKGRARCFFVGSRLYQVYILAPPERATSETINGFLDSFVLLDRAAGPMGPNMAAGEPPGGSAPGKRPGARRKRAANRKNQPADAPGPPSEPAPSPAAPATLAFYKIPDPASAAIEADNPGMGSNPKNPASGEGSGLGRSPAPVAAAQGASIKSFRWVDEEADMVGGAGAETKADGTKDQHLRLELELPPNTIIQLMSVTGGANHGWGTQPGEQYGPIGIFRRGRPVARSYVAQVGFFSGPQEFDLYLNTEPGIGPGDTFILELVLAIGGGHVTLTAQCKRPGQASRLLADARPSPPANASPAPPAATPGPAATPEPPPREEPQPKPEPAPEPPPREEPQPKPEPTPSARKPAIDFVPATEVPTFLTPSSGGATIVSFDWIDRNDDYVGTDGRRIGPGGGKDEHFRLVMDLPAAANIEEITITGGAVRWTTKPVARSWPVAVVANQDLKNRRQSLRVGAFSGRWTFDLYAESHETDYSGQPFGVDVVVFLRGSKHHLTARCQRK